MGLGQAEVSARGLQRADWGCYHSATKTLQNARQSLGKPGKLGMAQLPVGRVIPLVYSHLRNPLACVEGAVGYCPCGFESRLRHQII